MNRILKSMYFVIALLATAFASSALAQNSDNKQFTFQINSVSLNTDGSFTIAAQVSNTNVAASNSQIGSFKLQVNNDLTLVSASPDPTSQLQFGGTVLPLGADTVTVVNINPLKPGGRYIVNIVVKGCGDYKWTPDAWSGPQLNGTEYSDRSAGLLQEYSSIACGPSLACGGPLNPDPLGLINTTLTDNKGNQLSRRLPFNQDTGQCAPSDTVNLFVTNLDIGALHVRWDSNVGAAFFYVLNGALATNQKFGWNTTNGDPVTGTPVFVPAQVCDQGRKAQPPTLLGTAAATDGTTNKITVTSSGTTPPSTPFRIAIGPHPAEFFTVTQVKQQTWTLDHNPSARTVPSPVVSTPAPALPSSVSCFDSTGAATSCGSTYVPGGPALMCYVPSTDTSHAYIYDVGDGWTLGR